MEGPIMNFLRIWLCFLQIDKKKSWRLKVGASALFQSVRLFWFNQFVLRQTINSVLVRPVSGFILWIVGSIVLQQNKMMITQKTVLKTSGLSWMENSDNNDNFVRSKSKSKYCFQGLIRWTSSSSIITSLQSCVDRLWRKMPHHPTDLTSWDNIVT